MKTYFFSALMALVLLMTVDLSAQGVIKVKEALVLSFESPYKKLEVDIIDEKAGDFLSELLITDETIFVNKKDRPIDKSLIRPGVLLKVDGVIMNYQDIAERIELITNLEKDKVKADGIFEAWDGEVAIIDGQKVKLVKKTLIEGESNADCGCKGMKIPSFDQLEKGCFIEVKGSLGLEYV